MPVVELSNLAILAANVALWAVAHAGSGYVAHRLPLDRLQRDGPLLRLRAVERGGRLYERLGIRRWKDRLPEAGALFRDGLSKRSLPGGRAEGLERFAAETRRAERGHWLSLTCLPLFVLWNPPVGVALMVAYGVLVNLPFIAIQRYNRARVQRVLARRRDRLPG
ncbi:MAG TPA: hypothetical protein VHK88_00150 [Aquihabitans sp.]|nr:hypothetical protein [Aquihabitans sp.]